MLGVCDDECVVLRHHTRVLWMCGSVSVRRGWMVDQWMFRRTSHRLPVTCARQGMATPQITALSAQKKHLFFLFFYFFFLDYILFMAHRL